MRVFPVDGTYELFRHFYGVPPHRTAEGAEVAATRGVLSSVLGLLEQGVTHLGVATDHVIESFRNGLWPAYKTSAGLDPRLLGQFGLVEVALAAMGVVVWPMVELEADDALAGAAAVAADDPRVEQVVICTPDKDLGQCVRGARVVQLDRRQRIVYDEAGVTAKFGVGPRSIPDYLALRAMRGQAMLFKDLATLRVERSLLAGVDDLRWAGPTPVFAEVCEHIDARSLATRAARLATQEVRPD
jgi:5'-3' exonuclease